MPNQNEDNGTGILTPWGKRFFKIVGLLIGLALLIAFALSDRAGAEAPDPWDRSSIVLTGQCLPDGSAEFSVTNTGRDMAGASAWREYEADVLTQSGTFQLAAGAAQVWTFASNGVPIEFQADQRPGHPGNSHPRLTLTCTHTTQTVSTACVDDKATVNWTAGNYWGKPLLLQVVMGGQAAMVSLNDRETASGAFETGLATLPAGEVWFVWADSRGSWTEKVAYEARSCAPTALTLTAFSATSAGNRGACAEGNKVRGLPCTVTAFTPGYVSGTCDGGLTFSRVRTARTFRLDQAVTVQGCIGGADGWQLTSAPGMPLRISR